MTIKSELFYPENHTQERRARHFADSIMAVMRDYIPQDRQMWRQIHNHLYDLALETNVALVNVPPECDTLDKMALEQRMLRQSMERVTVWKDEAELHALGAKADQDRAEARVKEREKP